MSKAKFIEIVKDFDKNKVVILVSKRNTYLISFINFRGFSGIIKTTSNNSNTNESKKQTFNNSIDFYKKIKRLAYYKQMYVFN